MYDVKLTTSFFPAQTDEAVRPVTVGFILAEAARDSGTMPALKEALPDGAIGRQWTFAELDADATRLATALLSRFHPGERIAIYAPNIPEWVLLEFAAAKAGLVLVTVNPAYQPKELNYVVEQSRSAGLFFVESFRGNPMGDHARGAKAAIPALRDLIDLGNTDDLFAGAGARDLPAVKPDDPVQIQYTSGTTGFPKGAVLHHKGLANNARFALGRLGVAHGDTYLGVMPLFHTGGCAVGILGAVEQRACTLLVKMFDPAIVNLLVERERVTAFLGVPTMLVGMLEAHRAHKRDMSSLRTVMSGGAMVAPELVRAVKDTFGTTLCIIYGQTESSPGITQTRGTDSFEDRTGTIGQPYPQTDVAIMDSATGKIMPLGETGEICARGYCVMTGYNDNPKATEAAIDAQGWLHTGDLGTMDARGFVKITGRLKDMIIRGGENLFPAEIENVLLTHPAIAEAAVVGVPDEKWGELPVAFLRLHEGADVSRTELVAHLRKELAAPKTPAHWYRVTSWPLTGSGKIQKFVLREQWAAGAHDAGEI